LLNSISSYFRHIGPKRIGVMTLTFQGHMTSSIPHTQFPICFFRHIFGKTQRLATAYALETTNDRRKTLPSSFVTLCIVAKRCIIEQKLLLTAYRKSHRPMRNRLVPKWMTLTFV